MFYFLSLYPLLATPIRFTLPVLKAVYRQWSQLFPRPQADKELAYPNSYLIALFLTPWSYCHPRGSIELAFEPEINEVMEYMSLFLLVWMILKVTPTLKEVSMSALFLSSFSLLECVNKLLGLYIVYLLSWKKGLATSRNSLWPGGMIKSDKPYLLLLPKSAFLDWALKLAPLLPANRGCVLSFHWKLNSCRGSSSLLVFAWDSWIEKIERAFPTLTRTRARTEIIRPRAKANPIVRERVSL